MSLRVLGVPLVSALLFGACGESERSPAASEGGGGVSSAGRAGSSAQSGSAAGGQPQHGGFGAGGLPGEPSAGAVNAGAAGEGGGAGAAVGGQSPGGAGQAGDAGNGQGGDGVDPLPAPPNVVFVTSDAYLPAALGGLEGADDKCHDLALAAGLGGTFVAWLSTSNVDAKARLGAASAWRNTRGNPFADQATELLDDGQVYTPINFDEHGDPVSGVVATGTTATGRVAAQNCADWSSAAADAALVTGEPTAGSVLWTASDAGSSCAGEYHLYCFQVDHQALDFPTPSQGRTVFVSSQPFVLSAEGRAAADQLCVADAAAANLQDGPYVALLGTSTASALDRLTQPTRPWVRPDGMVVANGNSALGLGPLNAPITQQADGTHAGGVAIFGAAHVTDKAELNCDDWTNPNASVPAVIRGLTGHTDGRWYGAVTGSCAEAAHVLCVEK